jgi:hypothetical protein
MADNFYAPSVAENLATQAPLQGANMFAGANSLSNLMAQQQQIQNALQQNQQNAALFPGQLASQQNQLATQPQQLAANLAATQQGTASSAAGDIELPRANSIVKAELAVAFPPSSKVDLTQALAAVDKAFNPAGEKDKDGDPVTVTNGQVADFAAAIKAGVAEQKIQGATAQQNKEFAQLGQRMDAEVKSGRGNSLTQMINLANQGTTLIGQMGQHPMPQQLTQLQSILGSIASGGLSSSSGAGGDYGTLLNLLNSKLGFLSGSFSLLGQASLGDVLQRIQQQLNASKTTALNTLQGLLEASAQAYPDLNVPGSPAKQQVDQMVLAHMNALSQGAQLVTPPGSAGGGWSIVK